jgi:hypothetical protein
VERGVQDLLSLCGEQSIAGTLESKEQPDCEYIGGSKQTRVWKFFRTQAQAYWTMYGPNRVVADGSEPNPFAASKANAVLNAPLFAVVAVMLDNTKTKAISDGYTKAVDCFEELDPATQIVGTQLPGIFPVAARDFCNVNHLRFLPAMPGSTNACTAKIEDRNDVWKMARDGGPGTRLIMCNFSCDEVDRDVHGIVHPPIKSSIRGELFISGQILTAMEDGRTFIQSIQHANPGGSIPVWFLNNILKVAPPKINSAIERTAKKWLKKNKIPY